MAISSEIPIRYNSETFLHTCTELVLLVFVRFLLFAACPVSCLSLVVLPDLLRRVSSFPSTPHRWIRRSSDPICPSRIDLECFYSRSPFVLTFIITAASASSLSHMCRCVVCGVCMAKALERLSCHVGREDEQPRLRYSTPYGIAFRARFANGVQS